MSALSAWLVKSQMSQSGLARRVTAAPSHISRLLRGQRHPGLRLALAIERATGGAVTVESWASPGSPAPPKRRKTSRRSAA